ncbi:MAG: hypothetical protein ACI9FN_002474, partial [Saprospiraceae bacterium]
ADIRVPNSSNSLFVFLFVAFAANISADADI